MDEIIDKTMDMSDILCANCCEPIDQIELLFENDGSENYKRINTMLSVLYKLDYLGLDGQTSEKEEFNFRLCCTCLHLLNDLYNLYDKFNGLRKPESSSLAKKISLLESTFTSSYRTARMVVPQDNGQVPRLNDEIAMSQNPQDVEIFLRQDIFAQEGQSVKGPGDKQFERPKNFREYKDSVLSDKENSKSDSMKEPWIRLKRMDDITFTALGYAPASLLGGLESTTSDGLDVWDQQSVGQCSDDFNVDHETKLFGDPVIIETDNEVVKVESSTQSSGKRKISTRYQKTKQAEIQVESTPKRGRKKSKATKTKYTRKSSQRKNSTASTNLIKSNQKFADHTSSDVGDDSSDFMNSASASESFPPPASGLEIIKQLMEKKVDKKQEQHGQDHFKGKSRKNRNFTYLYSKRLEKSPCPCIYCLSDFQTPEERVAHTKLKHRTKFVCGSCGRKFKSNTAARYHEPRCGRDIERMTKKIESLVCSEPNCGKKFPNRRNLRAHAIVHGERNFPCSECSKSFKSAIALQNHHKNKHEEHDESSRVQCPECGSILKNENSLRYHYERKHTAEGNLKYKEYSKKTEERRKERRLATTADGFICTTCDVDFQTKNRLSKHRLTEHPDLFVKKFVCDLCGKAFIGSYQLRKHQTFTHTDERPYICDVCGKKYKSIDNLKDHQKISHDEEARAKYNEYTRLKNKKRKLLDLALAAKKQAQENNNFNDDQVQNNPTNNNMNVMDNPMYLLN